MKTRKNQGFTLIELMTTMLVAGVVLGIGVPALTQFIDTNQMASAVNDLNSSIHVARTEAVKRRANVTICPSADPSAANPTCNNAGSFADGWIVFVDCTVAPPPIGTCGAPNYAVDNFDTVVSINSGMVQEIADNFATNPGAPSYLSFGPTGFQRTIPALGAVQPKTDFQLCDDRGNEDVGGGISAGRWVRIAQTGRPQIYRNVAEVQSAQNPLGGCS